MNYARPLLLAASTVALFISACSTPADIQTPELAPQFGTVAEDSAISVDLGANGMIHVGSDRNYRREDSGGNPPVIGTELHVRQFDPAGNQRWKKTLKTDLTYVTGHSSEVTDVQTDGQGNVYALTSFSYFDFDDQPGESNTLYKLDKTGVLLWSKNVGNAPSYAIGLWVDAAGNAYVARSDESSAGGGAFGNFLTKYTSGGWVIWETKPGLSTLEDVVVSSSGNVYVVGDNGTSRYSSSGSLTWTKPVGGDEVVISGTNLFVRDGNIVRKLNGSGTQIWSRTQGGLSGFVVIGMTGDTSGNIYLSGSYTVIAENQNAFARKISPSGATVWTKTYGDSTYDDARAIDTLSGSDIYVVGASTGRVNGTNNGGLDAYILRLNGQGQRVWSR